MHVVKLTNTDLYFASRPAAVLVENSACSFAFEVYNIYTYLTVTIVQLMAFVVNLFKLYFSHLVLDVHIAVRAGSPLSKKIHFVRE